MGARRFFWAWAVVFALGAPAFAECPATIGAARQLVLVTTPGMDSLKADLRRFERPAADQPWREIGAASTAVVGATGIGWSAAMSETGPRKTEGDRRTPAGFFLLGRPFGFAASALPFYIRLAPGRQICVDDPASPDYGRIVTRAEDPKAHGEDMGRVSLYRRGVVIDYPVDAARRGGSCIFLHVWRAPTKGTVGCVALAEPAVATIQSWLRPGAMIGVLPKAVADKVLAACLLKS